MLSGKKVLITGAGGGIGKAICRLLASNGAELYLAEINEKFVVDIREELREKHKDIKLHCGFFDLSNKDDVVRLVQDANEKMDGIDIFIGNAGLNIDNLSIRMDNDQWQKVIDINLTANFILCREVLKIMMKKRFGRIINIASVVGLTGNAGQVNYTASKGGLIAMTKSFAIEFASRGITANCIAPGFIETPMTQKMTDDARKSITDRIPMKRYGTPEDIANAVLFLASDLSSYITGETLSVNGGLLMR